MTTQIGRRRILIAALAGAVFAALGITITSSHAAGSAHRNGRLAIAHHTQPGGLETVDIETIGPDGTDPRLLTASAPGTASDDPAWGEHGNRIDFDSDRAGNVHVFSMKDDGRDVTQLTRTDGWEFTPAVSGDGRLLAFEHDNADFSAGGIFVSDRRGGGLGDFRQLTDAPGLAAGGFDGDPDFSPDGRRIAFKRILDPTHGSGQAAIFVVGVDRTGLEQLTPYALDANRPSWSPDGSRIVFSSNDHNFPTPARIWVVNADGSGLTQLTTEPAGQGQDFLPDWSPDGTKIVYDRFVGESHFDLMVMNPDGSDVTTLSHGVDGSFNFRPAWGTRR